MNALEEFITQSTKDYLQSVVFVDDRIYDQSGHPMHAAESKIKVGNTLRPQRTSAPDERVDAPDAEVSEHDGHKEGDQTASYHPKELMESFARNGVACALYEPHKGFLINSGSEIHRLCERADVIILDWDLHNDDGDAVCSLLSLLIKESQAQAPHHVRLCTIYTDKPNLHQTLNRLLTNLEKNGNTVEVTPGKLQLAAGATRVSIFGKPSVIGRSPEDQSYEVQECNLADRIIEEFADLHCGFLPAFAVHGLAAVRRNTKRLVDKFRHQLDGPLMLDRALVLGTADVFAELPELLADEIRAVIEDSWPGKIDPDKVAKATIDSLKIQNPKKPWTTKNGQPFASKPALINLLKKGKRGISSAEKECNQFDHLKGKSDFRGVAPKLLDDLEAMLAIGGETHSLDLAALFCCRTQYDINARVLHFGTIIRHRESDCDKWSFSLCLMPICESQRLKAQTETFPFWQLDTNVRHGVSTRRHGIAVADPDGNPQCFAVGGRIRDKLWLAEFQPERGRILATEQGGVFTFPASRLKVQWVGELKPLHAQRAATHLGGQATRIGLVDSEWLRLFCDR